MIYICPTRFLNRDYGKTIRKYIYENFQVIEITDFGDKQNFVTATTYTGIFHFRKVHSNFKDNNNYLFKVNHQLNDENEIIFSSEILKKDEWYFNNIVNASIIEKIRYNSVAIRSLLDGIYQGIATGKDNVFIINKEEIERLGIEYKYLVKFLKGKNISTYEINWNNLFCIYPYDDYGKVIDEEIIKVDSPNLYKYLLENKMHLSGRDYFDKSTKKWFELWNQRNKHKFSLPKIMTLDNASKNSFAFDDSGIMGTTTTYSLVPKNQSNLKYILGILNSKLLNFYHKNNTIPQAGGFYRYQGIFIENLPINNNFLKSKINIVVETILTNKKENLDTTDLETKIDLMVYKLYELTYDEVLVVEPDFGLSAQEYDEFAM